MRFLLTGSSGFIGQYLAQHLRQSGHAVYTLNARIFNSQRQQEWLDYLCEVRPTAIIHLAGLAHRQLPSTLDSCRYLRAVNVDYPVSLAGIAAQADVPRFVFVSSIGVHGAQTPIGVPFREDSPFNPGNPYAESKCEAEHRLQALLASTTTQLVIVRPALVSGRGAPGNVNRLARLVHLGLPLPFANVDNQRSFVVIENLCDLLARAAIHPHAGNQAFLAAEAHTPSTAEVVACMARYWGRRPRLWSCPQKPLRLLLQWAGYQAQAGQLLGSVVVDSSKARQLIGWQPIKPLELSLYESAELDVKPVWS